MGTVFISNGVADGSLKYADNALSSPTTDTFNAEIKKQQMKFKEITSLFKYKL